jgi:glucan phosphorylase
MDRLLPRHMQIIYTSTGRHLERAAPRPASTDDERLAARLADRRRRRRNVRMGHLAFLGSHKVNGVSALHTDLMRSTVFSHAQRSVPDRIVNKTNGITFRRWLHQANPGLTSLLVETLGSRRPGRSPRLLAGLRAAGRRRGFQKRFAAAARRDNKDALAKRRSREHARRHGRPRRPVRRPDQAHPRIQAPAAQHPRDGRALRGDARMSRVRSLGAAREDLRRQGRGELPPRRSSSSS